MTTPHEPAASKPAEKPEESVASAVENAAQKRLENARAAVAKEKELAKPTLHLLHAFMKTEGPVQLSERGSALLVAHLLVELGEEKVLKWKPLEAITFAETWQRMHPMCWPPIRMGHPMRLIRFLEISGVKHDTVDGYNIAMTRIAPPQRQTGF